MDVQSSQQRPGLGVGCIKRHPEHQMCLALQWPKVHRWPGNMRGQHPSGWLPPILMGDIHSRSHGNACSCKPEKALCSGSTPIDGIRDTGLIRPRSHRTSRSAKLRWRRRHPAHQMHQRRDDGQEETDTGRRARSLDPRGRRSPREPCWTRRLQAPPDNRDTEGATEQSRSNTSRSFQILDEGIPGSRKGARCTPHIRHR